MPTTVNEIMQFMDNFGYSYKQVDASKIVTGFSMSNYVDKDGDHGLQLLIHLDEEGEMVKFVAPHVYQCNDSSKEPALTKALAAVAFHSKLLQMEYDPSDGEARAMIDLPLEDASLTQKQFKRPLHAMKEIIDAYDPVVRKALEEGQVDVSLAKSGNDMAQLFGALAQQLDPEQRQRLEQLLRDHGEEGGGSDDGSQGPPNKL